MSKYRFFFVSYVIKEVVADCGKSCDAQELGTIGVLNRKKEKKKQNQNLISGKVAVDELLMRLFTILRNLLVGSRNRTQVHQIRFREALRLRVGKGRRFRI